MSKKQRKLSQVVVGRSIERRCAPIDVVSGKMIDAAMLAGDDRTMRHGVATVALIRFASSVRRRVRGPEGLHYTEVKTL
jgi:hypothetical protein